ncbi:hypothetical protein DPMN_014124 [Dreissena polymorpha]|uniref:Shieldin complex subunit 2 first OB fold domain-containing protein n=1 Tax=Dreissena polymorpha TaxID=45954 RepID=A0A9D4HC88_DREPO|nr:hypothetical protein DPMN_131100 [Dreissena polymorpha]KAH3890055.1 hypothetical protein DPMN_014124 [Dreissena polymorpha]
MQYFMYSINSYEQEDEPREVQVQGGMVPIKTITVMDDSSKTQVTLWRDAVQSDVRPGDHVTITDVIVNSYQNVLSLSTTARSKIQVSIFLKFWHTFLCIKETFCISERYNFWIIVACRQARRLIT